MDLVSGLPLKMRLLHSLAGVNRGSCGARSTPPSGVPALPGFLGGAHFEAGSSPTPEDRDQPQARISAAAMSQSGGRDRTDAVSSNHYLNLHLRLGHLLVMVEAYITDRVNDNYLTFGFRETGAAPELRAIRVRLLQPSSTTWN